MNPMASPILGKTKGFKVASNQVRFLGCSRLYMLAVRLSLLDPQTVAQGI